MSPCKFCQSYARLYVNTCLYVRLHNIVVCPAHGAIRQWWGEAGGAALSDKPYVCPLGVCMGPGKGLDRPTTG